MNSHNKSIYEYSLTYRKRTKSETIGKYRIFVNNRGTSIVS